MNDELISRIESVIEALRNVLLFAFWRRAWKAIQEMSKDL